ncbi:hypothetical protein Tco_1293059 [Tanacetum coccineum]
MYIVLSVRQKLDGNSKRLSIEEIISEKRLIDDEIKDITNDLSYKRFRGEKIDDEYERDCEIKINQTLNDYNGLDYRMMRDKGERFNGRGTIDLDIFYIGESGRINKSCVEKLALCSQSHVSQESLFDEDVPKENFKIYSNPLFDDESFSNKNVSKEIYSNPLFDEEIISDKIDASIISSFKINSLLEQFFGKLAHIDPIPLGIEKANFDLEEEIRLVENLLYDNSSPRPPEELNLEIADTNLESFSPSPILVEDSDSHMEEIDLFLATNDSMPPGIEDDDYDSEGDIRFLEELLNNDSLPLPENESSNLDHFNDPSPSRPPPEPPDVEVFFDFEPDTGVLTTKVVKGISEHYVLMPNILPTLPTLDPDLDFTPSHDSLGSGNKIFDPGIFIEVQSERLLSRDEFSISFIRDPLSLVFDLLLPFSSENEDKVFNPGILISPLLSHRGKIISNFSKSPMMISRGDIPYLDVSYLHFYTP